MMAISIDILIHKKCFFLRRYIAAEQEDLFYFTFGLRRKQKEDRIILTYK